MSQFFCIQVKAFQGENLLGTEKITFPTDKKFRSPVGGKLEITYNTFGLMPRRGFRANYVAGNAKWLYFLLVSPGRQDFSVESHHK